ncbi:hypothetical protein [Anaerophilus nitritogenes]|uniref:hypothetical protein n=1 Tax=Anaerophilus nitritogenes TaxID=2498136 RepID=UPI00101D072A|nr:hypothetical protein [Anaerophilus nitritogenes]
MKKLFLVVLILLMIVILSVGCSKEKSQEDKKTEVENTSEIEKPYTFKGETHISVDDRSLVLEDVPKNMAEETVLKNFLYNITSEFSKMLDNRGDEDIQNSEILLENEEKSFKDGIYIQSYIIHEISTLKEKEYNEEKLDNGKLNPLYYYDWKECVKKYNLTEYEIVNVNFTQTHSKKSNELGPQWGDGKYYRNFIVGKTADDNVYKIFDFGMMWSRQ